jgi:predicted nucleotidyltransferase
MWNAPGIARRSSYPARYTERMARVDRADTAGQVRDVLLRDSDLLAGYLFGSAAHDAATPEREVDVGVLASAPLSDEHRTRLVREPTSATGRAIDLIDLRIAGMPILQIALSQGPELICRDRRAKERLITKMLADVEDFLPLRRRLLEARRERWIRGS